jgi:beta-lactamase superfamily II metal-dependent hydrolase
MAADQTDRFEFDHDLKLTVLGPSEQRVRKLHKEWEKNLKKDAAKALAAAFDDESPFNLSSIVVLAEIGGKRLLLTGDARGDHILEGMTQAGLLTDGTCHVDLLKVPHHGSDRNVTTEFFRQVTADHYVISANGRDDNPSIPTLEMITQAREDDDFTLHLTNRSGKNDLGKHLDRFFAAQKAKRRKFGVVFRTEAALSLKVDLLGKLTY